MHTVRYALAAFEDCDSGCDSLHEFSSYEFFYTEAQTQAVYMRLVVLKMSIFETAGVWGTFSSEQLVNLFMGTYSNVKKQIQIKVF